MIKPSLRRVMKGEQYGRTRRSQMNELMRGVRAVHRRPTTEEPVDGVAYRISPTTFRQRPIKPKPARRK